MKESIILGIIVSIIATIIISIFKPLLKKFGYFVLRILSKLSINFKNKIYSEASKGNLMRIPLFTLSLSIGFYMVVFFVFSNLIYFKNQENYKDATDMIEEVNGLVKKNSEELPKQSISYDELSTNVHKMKRISGQMRIVIIIMVIIILVWFLIQYIKYIRLLIINELYVNFHHKLLLLSKTIDKEEIKNLKIDWALMENFEDYEKLKNKVEKLKIK